MPAVRSVVFTMAVDLRCCWHWPHLAQDIHCGKHQCLKMFARHHKHFFFFGYHIVWWMFVTVINSIICLLDVDYCLLKWCFGQPHSCRNVDMEQNGFSLDHLSVVELQQHLPLQDLDRRQGNCTRRLLVVCSWLCYYTVERMCLPASCHHLTCRMKLSPVDWFWLKNAVSWVSGSWPKVYINYIVDRLSIGTTSPQPAQDVDHAKARRHQSRFHKAILKNCV